MRRGLAILLVLSLYSLQVQSLAFHVHAVSDHAEDRDHQHGPAIHHHDDFDAVRHVGEEEQPAGGAVITIAVPAATVSSALVADAELPEALEVQALQPNGDIRSIDVRSHGPPESRSETLRGPPAPRHS